MSGSFRIEVVDGEQPFDCLPGERLLFAMQRAGIKQIPVGCRAGGCGVCRVQVLSGEYHLGKLSRLHVTEKEQRGGYALACKVFPEGDLRVQLAPREPQEKTDETVGDEAEI